MGYKKARRKLLEKWQREDYDWGFRDGVVDTVKTFARMSDEDFKYFRDGVDKASDPV